MTITPHHVKFFAHELTKRCSADSVEKLAGALVDAQVDLNPRQVEAALFLPSTRPEAKRAATLALSLEEKLAGQKQIRAIEGKLAQRTTCEVVLSIRWRLS